MDNAIIFEGLTADDIQKVKAIKDAYDNLPQAFAEEQRKTFEKKGYETQIASNYSNYCYIWDKNYYTKNHLWLAVGFSHEACYFYIVSNDQNTFKKYSDWLNVAKSSESYGNIWLKPIEESRFLIKFTGKPDADKLSENIIYWLNKLKIVL